jgi:hypothetical protein
MTNGGLTKDQARLIADGGGSPGALTGRAKSAWIAHESRLRDLASAEESFRGYAEGIAKAHADFIPRAEKRLTKKGFAHGGRITGTDMEVRHRLADLPIRAATGRLDAGIRGRQSCHCQRPHAEAATSPLGAF